MSNNLIPAGCCCGAGEGAGSHGELVPCHCFDEANIAVCFVPEEVCGKIFLIHGVCYQLTCDPDDTFPGCWPHEVRWPTIPSIQVDSCEKPQCCRDDEPGPCEILDECCGEDQQPADLSFTLDISDGYSGFGGCQCTNPPSSGASEDHHPECFGHAKFNEQIGDGGQQSLDCDSDEGSWLRCTFFDICGTLRTLVRPDTTEPIDTPPTGAIRNCFQVDDACCPDTHRLTDSLDCGPTSGPSGGPYTVGSMRPNCPHGCSYWGCFHLAYSCGAEINIPCKETDGSSSPTIEYEGAGALRVPLLELGHLCGGGIPFGQTPYGNCVPVTCYFGGVSPWAVERSWSIGYKAIQSVMGIWTARVEFAHDIDCTGGVSVAEVTFTPDDPEDLGGAASLTWQIPPKDPIGGMSHPCSGEFGGTKIKGAFNWAKHIFENFSDHLFADEAMVEDFLDNCGPSFYVPSYLNATGVGQSGYIVSEFLDLWDNTNPEPILATKLAAYREAITDFNLFGPNADMGVWHAEGFNGCRPAAPCDLCGPQPIGGGPLTPGAPDIYNAACHPKAAIIQHSFSITY